MQMYKKISKVSITFIQTENVKYVRFHVFPKNSSFFKIFQNVSISSLVYFYRKPLFIKKVLYALNYLSVCLWAIPYGIFPANSHKILFVLRDNLKNK
jgi:hypothetical protein